MSLVGVGASPRVRAYLGMRGIVNIKNGDTPACAGLPRYHPSVQEVYRGLPPRVRAYPLVSVTQGAQPRSTPACAGLPTAAGRWTFAAGVYPRVCGLTAGGHARGSLVYGLPPRVRAYRRATSWQLLISGSTPACAGLPRKTLSFRPRHPVYPRVCGLTPCRIILLIGIPGEVFRWLFLAGVPSVQHGRSFSTPLRARPPVRRVCPPWGSIPSRSPSTRWPPGRACPVPRCPSRHPASCRDLRPSPSHPASAPG